MALGASTSTRKVFMRSAEGKTASGAAGKTHILYINSSYDIYGAERRMFDIISHLDPAKFRASLLVSQEGTLAQSARERGMGVIVLDYKFKVLFRNIKRFFRLNLELLRMIKAMGIDLIHVNLHYRFSNFWLAFLLSRKPVVMHLRSHVWMDIFERFVAGRCSRIICVSEYVRGLLLKTRRSDLLVRIRKERVSVLYDGIDMVAFRQRGAGVLRSDRRFCGAGNLVGIVGAIDPIKGQDIFVDAARLVCDVRPETKFLIVGDLYHAFDPPKIKKIFKKGLIRSIRDQDLKRNVFLLGFREDIPQVMDSLDIVVQPSEREALGTSIVEAMACGKPVIGSNVDGIPEVIGRDGAGILLGSRTAEELAVAILFYLERPFEAAKAGIIGRKRAEEMFNMRKNIRILEEIYLKEKGSHLCRRHLY